MNGAEKDSRETIRLYYRNEFGSEFEMGQTAETYSELGEDTIREFSRIINLFLKHIGYVSYDKDMVFLESVTEEEYEDLLWYLDELRQNKTEGSDE